MWKYNKKWIKSLRDIPKDKEYDHFIYKITNKVNGKFYIGKKILYNKQRVKLSKKKKKELNTRKIFEINVRESDWLNYYGSSKDLLYDISVLGTDKFDKEIIKFVKGKKAATAWEIYYIIKTDSLLIENSYNGNLLGRIYKKDFLDG